MSEVYTALLVIMAIHNGGIEKVREMPFESMQQCEQAKQRMDQEPDPQGYAFVAHCLAAGGQQT